MALDRFHTPRLSVPSFGKGLIQLGGLVVAFNGHIVVSLPVEGIAFAYQMAASLGNVFEDLIISLHSLFVFTQFIKSEALVVPCQSIVIIDCESMVIGLERFIQPSQTV